MDEPKKETEQEKYIREVCAIGSRFERQAILTEIVSRINRERNKRMHQKQKV